MEEKPFLLLSGFLRAFSHKLRTPLSVVSNDLHHFKSHFAEGECDRSLKRVQDISELVHKMSSIGESPLVLKRNSITSILKNSSLGSKLEFASPEDIDIEADEERLGIAFNLLTELLEGVSGKFKVSEHVGYLALKLRSPVSMAGRPEWLKRYSTFTEVFSYRFEFDSVLPPLIDSILGAHDCIVTLSFRDEDLVVDVVFTSI